MLGEQLFHSAQVVVARAIHVVALQAAQAGQVARRDLEDRLEGEHGARGVVALVQVVIRHDGQGAHAFVVRLGGADGVEEAARDARTLAGGQLRAVDRGYGDGVAWILGEHGAIELRRATPAARAFQRVG